jgi:hypothetical protein
MHLSIPQARKKVSHPLFNYSNNNTQHRLRPLHLDVVLYVTVWFLYDEEKVS